MMMQINMIHFRRASGRWAPMAVLFVVAVAVAVALRPGAAPPANAAAAPADTGHGGEATLESVPGERAVLDGRAGSRPSYVPPPSPAAPGAFVAPGVVAAAAAP